jgi:antitoxin PrlF
MRATSSEQHIFEMKSKVTERGQTTLPSKLREALNLEKGDEITYSITPDGQWVLSKSKGKNIDPAISAFLSFLENDISTHPENLKSINESLYQSIKSNVEGVEFDLGSPLSEDDE